MRESVRERVPLCVVWFIYVCLYDLCINAGFLFVVSASM